MRRHPARFTATVGLLLAATAGCSSGPDPGPVFNNEGGTEVGCMTHQTDLPGARYTVREMRNTGEVLALMKYYTANGAKPYCDNSAAAEPDKAWGQLYVDLGGTTEKAATALA